MKIVAKWYKANCNKSCDAVKFDDGQYGWVDSKSQDIKQEYIYSVDTLTKRFPKDILTRIALGQIKPDWELVYSPQKSKSETNTTPNKQKLQKRILGKTNVIGCTCGGWIYAGHIHSDWCDCKK